MSDISAATKAARWFHIAIVAAFIIFILKGCHKQREQGMLEQKGIGMLEAKGLYSIHPEAAKDYYMMVNSGAHTAAELSAFRDALRIWKFGYRELSKRGLSESDIMAIPYYELNSAMTNANREAALQKLVRKYN